MAEWPQERRLRNNPKIAQPHLADIPSSILDEAKATDAFAGLIEAVLDGFANARDPKAQLAHLSTQLQSAELAIYGEAQLDPILALACIEALLSNPTGELWEFLWSLAWHSSALERYLPDAVIAASAQPDFKGVFFTVARRVMENAAAHPGRRAMVLEKEIGVSLREEWRKHPRLSALWRNNFMRSFHAVSRDDDGVLSIVAEIDVAEFVRLLELFDYPDPVTHALAWSGRGAWRFERWKALALASPPAFDEEGRWNGSLILPLLLAIAREQFQFPLGRNPTNTQIADAGAEISGLAAEVAGSLASRGDASGCAARWGDWLVYTGIQAVSANAVPIPANAGSHGFIESTLFDALIGAASGMTWSEDAAPDAEAWEPWCHLAAGTMVALSRKKPMPSPSQFLGEWTLTPEQWMEERGQMLKAHAAPFGAVVVKADGYGARLLALSIVEDGPAGQSWRSFWDSTDTLREIVEFGDSSDSSNGGWPNRTEAGRLLMLQFSIGLMMLDHLIVLQPQRTLNYDRKSAMEGLLPLLGSAAREMTAIDQLNGKYWSEATRHLAIRRAAWLSGSRPGASDAIILDAAVKPTLADFLRDLQGDTEGLLILAYVALQNGAKQAVVGQAFASAGVNLSHEIDIAGRLLNISPKAFGLSTEHLDVVRALLKTAQPPPSSLQNI